MHTFAHAGEIYLASPPTGMSFRGGRKPNTPELRIKHMPLKLGLYHTNINNNNNNNNNLKWLWFVYSTGIMGAMDSVKRKHLF